MWIKNNADIKRLKDTINKCSHSVWVLTDSEEKYDMTDSFGFYLGLASLMKDNKPEVFAESKDDEILLLNYLYKNEQLAHAC